MLLSFDCKDLTGVVIVSSPVGALSYTLWVLYVVEDTSHGGFMSIFTILFAALLVAWLLGIGVFHVAGGFIHILLLLAIVSLIMHFVRGQTSTG